MPNDGRRTVTVDELRTRLAAIVAAAQPGRITHGTELSDMLDRPPTPAAVLVPFVLGATPGVLLTKRTAHLDKHAGQVSFPGGRIDPDGLRLDPASRSSRFPFPRPHRRGPIEA